MNSVSQCLVGIDVAKETLMTTIGGKKPFKSANTLVGIDSLKSRLPKGAIIHLEASGGYERLLRSKLLEAGFEVHRHNPRSVEQMRKPLGFTAKTDPQDALLIEAAGKVLKTPCGKSVEREALCDLSRTIEYLKRERIKLMHRLGTPQMDAQAIAEMKIVAAYLAERIQSMESSFKARILKSSWAPAYRCVLSVPYVGPVLARVLICELPEDLSSYSTAKISAYAGIAPKDDSSGNRTGPKRIEPGNMHVKRALYMPALNAVGRLPWAKELYKKLVAKGRHPLQALVAVMRRLLTMAVSVLKRGTPWTQEAPLPAFLNSSK